MKSISVRLVTAAAVWVAPALIAGGFLLSNLFREPLEEAFDQRLEFLLQSVISAVDISADGRIGSRRPIGEARFRRQYSGLYWQIARADGRDILDRSRSMWDFELPPTPQDNNASVRRSYVVAGPLGQNLRVIELRVTEEGVPGAYLFSVAADTDEVGAAVASFNVTLIWSFGLLGLGLILGVIAQVYYGLLPLQRVRAALSATRNGRAERLDGEFPREVAPLASELNGLLEHTTLVLARARANVGNLAHALKTPLAVLANEGDSPSSRIGEIVREQSGLMRRQVDHHLSLARLVEHAPILRSQTELLPVMQAVARTLEKIHAERGVGVIVEGSPSLAFRGEQNDLEEMLGNLVDNACKWANSVVQLTAAGGQSGSGVEFQLEIHVDDDGSGIPEAMRDEIFDRGRRGDEATPGSGLGLAIVRDIAALYGGNVILTESPLGGLRASLTLPGLVTE